ncbi:PepSY domain-containing protein [Morganella psychrotolerans]|uniref:PepSY domain-containing protein n=1 Tax=Morganella psychrotolerans TaxID=368603 RepID=UPI002286EFBB|nr:PepSY domain-containing protein [Morganella psychrotolerans]
MLIAVTGIFLARPDILSIIPEYKPLITQLHQDMGIGIPGVIIAFLSGILLPLLYVSGIVIWWKKKKTSA